MIMPYDRDAHGDLAIFDQLTGFCRFLTEAERAARRAKEADEAAKLAHWHVEHPNCLGGLTPHPNNKNRVSYGRTEILSNGATLNWTIQD